MLSLKYMFDIFSGNGAPSQKITKIVYRFLLLISENCVHWTRNGCQTDYLPKEKRFIYAFRENLTECVYL